MDAILKRRSIRKFLDQPIPEEALEKILRAGMAAPSAGRQCRMGVVLFGDPKKKESAHGSERVCVPGKNRAGVYGGMRQPGSGDPQRPRMVGAGLQRGHGKHAAGGNRSGHRQHLAGHLSV